MKTLFLAWQDPKTRLWFPIGKLNYDGEYYQFIYTQGAKKAQAESQFQPLISFPNLDKIYQSPALFPLFSNRLMPRSRPSYKNYIEWLNIPENEDEPITILARSGGQKATDTFEMFAKPELDQNGHYQIQFFARGVRYFPESSIERVNDLQEDEPLFLVHDPENKYDPFALLIQTEDHYNIGYCPRYLTKDIYKLMQKSYQPIHVCVARVNLNPTPIQLRLLCNLTAEWPSDFQPFSDEEYQPLSF